MEKIKPYSLIVLILLIYAATIPLNSFLKASFIEREKAPDIIQNIFGGMRDFVADWAFMKAEEYHHRGLPFFEAIAYHNGQAAFMEETQGTEEEEHHHAEKDVKNDLYSRIYRAVKVTEDSHLTPAHEKEVLPWFYTEVAFNPHDIRGYVLGGYWLERLGRNSESLEFLKEGERNNPDSAQILGSIGKLYYRGNKTEEALLCLERARKLWLDRKPPNVPTNNYIESDRLVTFKMLGYLYEKEGRYDRAAGVYGDYLRFGRDRGIEEKIIKLKNMAKTVE